MHVIIKNFLIGEGHISQYFPGITSISRELPVFPAILGNMSISRLFANLGSGGHFVHRSGTVLAILVKGHLSNIPMKFK